MTAWRGSKETVGGKLVKISIEEIPKSKEEEVVIRCHGMNEEVMALLHKLKTAGEKLIGSQKRMHKMVLL